MGPRNIRVRRTQEAAKPRKTRRLFELCARLVEWSGLLFKDAATALARMSASTAAWVAGTCLVLALGIGLTYWIRNHSVFHLKHLQWHGLSKLSSDQLTHVAGLNANISVVALSEGTLRTRLLRHPWVSAVHIEKRLPDTLIIQVRERYPVALLKLTDREQWLTSDAQIVTQAPPFVVDDLPEVSGMHPTLWQHDVAYRTALLMTTLSMLKDHARWADESEAIASLVWATDDSAELQLLDGTKVFLGQGPYSEKISRLVTLQRSTAACHAQPRTVFLDHDQRPDWATLRY